MGELRRSPLHAVHEEAGADFTAFNGWEMPVEFGGIKMEHLGVREVVGKFDVSHMGRVGVAGPDATELMDRLVTADVTALDPGTAAYAAITDEEGIMLDDTVMFALPEASEAEYLFVPNAGHDEATLERWRTHRDRWDLDASVENVTEELAMFAVQGPDAATTLGTALDRSAGDGGTAGEADETTRDADGERAGDAGGGAIEDADGGAAGDASDATAGADDGAPEDAGEERPWDAAEESSPRVELPPYVRVEDLPPEATVELEAASMDVAPVALGHFELTYETIDGVEVLISRTGYTGEDGFELVVPAEAAADVWGALGANPCGLGARDTLRMEAGFLLSGQDFDPDERPRTPYEAGIGFAVDLDGEFVGRDALARQAEAGVERTFVGLRLLDRGVPREGYPIETVDGEEIGEVTSGTVSPSLDEPIGLGYVPPEYADPERTVRVVVRGTPKRARIETLPFVG